MFVGSSRFNLRSIVINLTYLFRQFKRLLNRELKDFSEGTQSGNEVSAWVYNTFVGMYISFNMEDVWVYSRAYTAFC